MSGKLDIDVDEGWFSAELTQAPTALAPDEPGTRRMPETLAAQMPEAEWDRLVETLAAYEREVAALVNPRRRAALCYEIGRIYETRLGDERRAVAAYQRAHRADPFHLPTLRAGRGVFARAGRWPMVISLLDAELRADPNPGRRARLLVEKGEVYLRCDEPASARQCYEAALELAPDHRAALRALAQLAAAAGDAARLAACLERQAAQSRDPAFVVRLLCDAAAVRLGRRANDEHAVALLESARALAPDDSEVVDLLARAHRRAGRWEALVNLLESAPHRFEASMSRAERMTETARLIADQLGDNHRAVGLLEQALAADPWCAPALELLAEIHDRDGRAAAAVSTLQRLSGVTRDVSVRVRLLSRIAELQLNRLDDEEGAITSLTRLLESQPTEATALESLGRLLSRRGEWYRLLQVYAGELAQIEEPRARANKLFKMGELAEHRLRDLAHAAHWYREALLHTPGFLHASQALLRVLRAAGDVVGLAEALAFEAGRTEAPEERLVALEELGELQAGVLNTPDAALLTWREVLALRPEHSAARRHVVRLTERLGLHAELLVALEQEMESTRDEARLLSLLVQCAETCDRALGDAAQARRFLERALALSPRFLPALQSMGRILHAAGDWQELISMYRRELEISRSVSDTAQLHFKIGVVLRDQLAEPAEAVRAFEKVLELVPGHLPAIRALQALFVETGDLPHEAEALAAEAESLVDPNARAAMFCRLGALYQHRMGHLDLAAEALQRAVSLQSGAEVALVPLIAVHEERGDDHELAAALRRLAETRTEPAAAADAWVQVAHVCADRLHLDVEAVEACERALSLTPVHPHVGALLHLERLYRSTHAPSDLARVLGRLADVVSTPEDRLEYRLAEARLRADFLDDPAASDAAWVQVLALDPTSLEALDRLEALRTLRHDHEAVLWVLERRLEATAEPRDQVTILLRRAEILQTLDRPTEAASALEQAARIDPGNLPVARALRGLCTALARGDDALRWTEIEARLTADAEAATELHLVAARIREQRKSDFDGAFQAFAAALERQPQNEEAGAGLQRVGERLGRHADVVRVLEQRAAAAPERATEMLVEAAGLYVRRLGSPEQAVRALNLALKQAPHQTPAILQRLADLYAEQEDWTEAAAVYEQLRDVSEDPELRRAVGYRLAAIFEEKQPDPMRARACLDRILEAFPEDVDAWLRLARICEASADVGAALDALRRASLAVSGDGDKARVLARIGEVEAGRGRADAALLAWEASLGLEPAQPGIALAVAEHRAARGETAALVETLVPVLEALARRGAPATDLGAFRRRAARLVLPHDPARAVGELERLVQENPDDLEARGLLAGALAAGDDALDRAANHLVALVAHDPFAAEPLRRLCDVSRRMGAWDRAWQLAIWLGVLGEAGPPEHALVSGMTDHIVRWPARPLDTALRLRLRSPREVPMLDELLVVVARALPRLFGAPPTVPTREVNTAELEATARRCGQCLGVDDVRVLTDRTLGDGVRYTDAWPPMLVFGAGAVDRFGAAEHAFLVARGIELGTRRLAGLVSWEWRAVRTLLETLVCLDGWRPADAGGPGPEEIEQRLEQVGGLLDPRMQRALETRLPDLRRMLPGLDLGAALGAIEETADRVGLLCAGTMAPASSVLRRLGTEPPGGTNAERLAGVPRIRALARWLVDDELYALRAQLGLAPMI
ncbi:tetratricopeptide repeat protein [Myxococcota bacterium]|nr:tetratricopeptide repeat protein [Myxococcota bacterium]